MLTYPSVFNLCQAHEEEDALLWLSKDLSSMGTEVTMYELKKYRLELTFLNAGDPGKIVFRLGDLQ